jgi:hypothetical protein
MSGEATVGIAVPGCRFASEPGTVVIGGAGAAAAAAPPDLEMFGRSVPADTAAGADAVSRVVPNGAACTFGSLVVEEKVKSNALAWPVAENVTCAWRWIGRPV